MKINPKVSVIIPCYGVEKYLDRCMSSVVRQSLRDIEIILVDDGSKDNVPQICDDWALKDDRIKVVHKQNAGLGYARNSGLNVATGQYVAFLDADDFVDINMYQALYDKAIAEKADAVYCNCVMYKDEEHQFPRMDVKEEHVFKGKDEVRKFLLDIVGPEPESPQLVKYMMSVWHSVFRRELFVENNIAFVSERELISEDLIFDIDMLTCCSRVVYVPETYYFYCDNGASLSRKVDNTRYKRNKIFLTELEKRLENVFEKDEYYLHYLRQAYHRMLASLHQAIDYPTQDYNMKSVLNDEFWAPLLNDYPYKRMTNGHKVMFICLRNKSLWWILWLYMKLMWGK